MIGESDRDIRDNFDELTGNLEEDDVASYGPDEVSGAYGDCDDGDPDVCSVGIWVCRTCNQSYCEAHNHRTSKGENVECISCESARKGDADAG